MAETTANTVADFIIKDFRDRGYYITNLKLQKLLFYAQAWHLAIEEKPLFDEDFQKAIVCSNRFSDKNLSGARCAPY